MASIPTREPSPAPLTVRSGEREFDALSGWADALPLQVWTASPDGQLDYVNIRVLEFFDATLDEVLGSGWLAVLHPDDVEGTIERWTASLQTGELYSALFRLRSAHGRYCWHLAQARPAYNENGEIVRWFGTNSDVHDRVTAERAMADKERKLEFLSRASRELATTLDFEVTLHKIARLAVPQFADWCLVELLEDGKLMHLVIEHVDQEKIELVRELQLRYPTDPDAPTGVPNVLRTGKSEWAPEIPLALLEESAHDEEHLALLRSLALHSYIIAPLASHDGVLGTMTFVYAGEERRYAEDDLALVEDLARRAAVAIQNARLVRNLQEANQSLELQAEELESANEHLQNTVDQLERSETLLAEAQAAARLGSWEWDIRTNDLAWTSELYRLFGLDPTDEGVSLETYLSYIHEDDRDTARAVIDNAFKTQEPFSFDHRIVRADGVVNHIQSRGRVISDEAGEPIRMTGSAQDITEQKNIHDALQSARLEAENANQAKSNFLASMSHELRTPLNAIGGHLELVDMGLRGEVTPAQKEAFKRIRANQRHLLGLINDVLQFAKIEAGHLEVTVEDFDLGVLVKESMAMLEPQAKAKHLEFSLGTFPPVVARGDEERVRQILFNLINNAIKFTEEGGSIDVGIRIGEGTAYVSVADTGRGIAAEMMDAIFDPFVQVGRDRASSHHGVGLGLAISRDLARAMAGDIAVESKVDRGSTFTLHLPMSEKDRMRGSS